jgi:hypothetical protein
MNESEKEMSNWLASPMEFGEHPIQIKEIHREKTVWPLMDGQVDLVFHKYQYKNGYIGIGMTGPITCSFLEIDISGFEMWELKRLYAGWYIALKAIHSPAYSRKNNNKEKEDLEKRLKKEKPGFIEILDYLSFGKLIFYAYSINQEGKEIVIVTNTKYKSEFEKGSKYLRLPPLYYFLGGLFYDGSF